MRGARSGRLAVVGCILALSVAGCGPSQPQFSGSIEYKNESADDLYVSSLTGFRGKSDCGILPPGISKSLTLGRMGYPREATLNYRVGKREAESEAKSQVLDLDALLKNDPNAALYLEYTKEGKWTVTAKPYK